MTKSQTVRFEIRLNAEEHADFERVSRERGHRTIASWLRQLAKADVRKLDREMMP